MLRLQDAIALLRGAQLVFKESVKIQEQYVKHVWANSSVREAIEGGMQQAQSNVNKMKENPNQELESISQMVQETAERVSVVAQGMISMVSSTLKPGTSTGDNGKVHAGMLKDIDISNTSLKELEALLNRKYDQIKVENNKSKLIPKEQLKSSEEIENVKSSIPPVVPKSTPELDTNMERISKDESNVKEWMNVLTTPGKKTTQSATSSSDSNDKKNEMPVMTELSKIAKQRKVPSSRIGRMVSFGSLFAGLGIGTATEMAKGAIGVGNATTMKEALFSSSNVERIVDTLCKVRGAALKLGQILSIQDSSGMISPELAKAMERVRQSADYMPDWQVKKVLRNTFGEEWRSKFNEFEDQPFAAASIGQVHRGTLMDGTKVAIKIQYPGVARSIESDIDNLVTTLKIWDIFPPGIFIDNIVKVAKRELAWEVDYIREADYTEKFGEMIADHNEYRVPKVIRELSTAEILTTEYVPGYPLDKCFNLSHEHRHFIGQAVMKLCLLELFQMQCMQTDPNWSNFLYDPKEMKLMLIDFGSTRFYSKDFIANYKNIIIAAVEDRREDVLEQSRTMGFLTGYETKQMEDAHVNAVMILGELFRTEGEFDFSNQNTIQRLSSLVPTMIAHRLCPPPEEIYSIHRKLTGVFLLCTRLKIRLACKPLFEEIVLHR